MIKTVIFDFDGLILDTETPDFLSWQETYAAYGVSLPEAIWAEYIGTTAFNPYEYLEECLGHPVNRQEVHARRKERDSELIAVQTILPGVESYLAEARQAGIQIGLASSSRHDWVDFHLNRLGLFDSFAVICCQDDVGNRSKPDPAVYTLALELLDTRGEEALALEDSPNGIAAAKKAGLWVTAVPNRMTGHLDLGAADFRLKSLAEMSLLSLVEELMNGKK